MLSRCCRCTAARGGRVALPSLDCCGTAARCYERHDWSATSRTTASDRSGSVALLLVSRHRRARRRRSQQRLCCATASTAAAAAAAAPCLSQRCCCCCCCCCCCRPAAAPQEARCQLCCSCWFCCCCCSRRTRCKRVGSAGAVSALSPCLAQVALRRSPDGLSVTGQRLARQKADRALVSARLSTDEEVTRRRRQCRGSAAARGAREHSALSPRGCPRPAARRRR